MFIRGTVSSWHAHHSCDLLVIHFRCDSPSKANCLSFAWSSLPQEDTTTWVPPTASSRTQTKSQEGHVVVAWRKNSKAGFDFTCYHCSRSDRRTGGVVFQQIASRFRELLLRYSSGIRSRMLAASTAEEYENSLGRRYTRQMAVFTWPGQRSDSSFYSCMETPGSKITSSHHGTEKNRHESTVYTPAIAMNTVPGTAA